MRGRARDLDDKLRAAFAYLITGNSLDASKLCGIPDRTIREMTEQPWWSAVLSEAKGMKNEELDSIYTRIIEKALDGVEDRLDNGEEVIDKFGNRVKKGVSARDAAIIAATFQDKRAIIRGEPTNITKKINEKERLAEIASGLDNLGETKEETPRRTLTH